MDENVILLHIQEKTIQTKGTLTLQYCYLTTRQMTNQQIFCKGLIPKCGNLVQESLTIRRPRGSSRTR